MENAKSTDQSSQRNKYQSTQSTGNSGRSQSQTNNPQKDKEQSIVNEQEQYNPVNPQEKTSGQGQSSGDYSSEKDMNGGQQSGTNWGEQVNTSRDQGAAGGGDGATTNQRTDYDDDEKNTSK